MDFDKQDHFPEFSLTFSPNWYLPQIFAFNSNELCAFGSNDEIYLMKLPAKRIVTSLTITMPEAFRIKEPNKKKISAIFMNLRHLVCTNFQGYIAIFDLTSDNFPQVYFGDLEIQKEVFYIKEIKSSMDFLFSSSSLSSEEEKRPDDLLDLVLADNEKYIVVAQFNGEFLEHEVMERKGKTVQTKFFELFTLNYPGVALEVCVKIMENGMVNIWDSSFRKLVYAMDTKMKVSAATAFLKSGFLYIASMEKLLQSKEQKGDSQTGFRIEIAKLSLWDILNEFKKTQKKVSGSFCEQMVRMDVSFGYPSKIAHDPDVAKAIPTFWFLNEERVSLLSLSLAMRHFDGLILSSCCFLGKWASCTRFGSK